MLFHADLHWCPLCQDFVPYVNAVRGAGCSECGRLFTPEDQRDYLEYRGWGERKIRLEPAGPADQILPEPAVG